MLKTAERFKAEILRRLDEVTEGQDEAIHEAAVIMADTIERGGIIRAFGSGHSHANALEICGRAGGYIQTKIVREPALGIYEMLNGVGNQFWLKLDVRPEDCLVLISNSGRNPLPVELALHAREAGVKVIVVTAREVSAAGTSRSKTGKLLYELGDVVLDNKSCFGDAALEGLSPGGAFLPTTLSGHASRPPSSCSSCALCGPPAGTRFPRPHPRACFPSSTRARRRTAHGAQASPGTSPP